MLKTHRYVTMLLLAGAVATAPACAARVYGTARGGYDGGGGYYVQFQRYAYENGYRHGRDRGRDDWRSRHVYDYGRFREYRNADDGFRNDGDRDVYRREYRRGF